MLRLRSVYKEERASSAIEYSLILALVAAVALMTVETAAPVFQGTFGKLAANGGDGFVSSAVVANSSAANSPPANSVNAQGWHITLALAAILTASVGLVLCRLPRRRGKQELDEEAEEETTPEVPEPVDGLFDKRQRMLRFLSSNAQVVLGSQLAARHLMTQRLETIRPSDCVAELKQRTAVKGIHHLLVTNAEGRLLGIISDRDLMGRSGKTAGEIMTASPITIEPQTPLSSALTLLVHSRISCLPVVEGEKACGIITTTDVILGLQCIIQTLERVGAVTHDMFQEGMVTRPAPECEVSAELATSA